MFHKSFCFFPLFCDSHRNYQDQTINLHQHEKWVELLLLLRSYLERCRTRIVVGKRWNSKTKKNLYTLRKLQEWNCGIKDYLESSQRRYYVAIHNSSWCAPPWLITFNLASLIILNEDIYDPWMIHKLFLFFVCSVPLNLH